MKFVQSKNDSCLYCRGTGENRVYLAVYVDDIVFACRTEEEYQQIIRNLNKYFTVTSLGDIRNFLGVEVRRTDEGIKLNQARYIRKLLSRFGMEDAKPSKFPLDPGHLQTKEESVKLPNNTQYASLVGGLLYVAVNTRPDIAVSVSILGRKVSCPSQADWVEAKRILRYLKYTIDHELTLGINAEPLTVYVDADWAGDAEDRKSTSGFLFQLGGGTIYWSSKKQTCVTLSSTEAEYIALAECCQEVKWIMRILEDFAVPVDLPVTIFEDNQSCIKQLSSSTVNRRSKHVETKNHFVREMQTNGEIQAIYCPTEEMIADMLTKPLQAIKLEKFRVAAGINQRGGVLE